MEFNRQTLERVLKKPVTIEGYTDLSIDGLKCSGNAQRRTKNYVLFHGTFLCHLDINLIDQLLKIPKKQPAYRQNRGHLDFLTNLNVSAGKIKSELARTWKAKQPLRLLPLTLIDRLVQEKYEKPLWNFKF